MKVHYIPGDTMQSIYEKCRIAERAFLDQHYREVGPWRGSIGIEIVVKAHEWHDFMRMLPNDQQHEVLHSRTLMGLLVFRNGPHKPAALAELEKKP